MVKKYKPEKHRTENQRKSCICPLNATPTTGLLTTEDLKEDISAENYQRASTDAGYKSTIIVTLSVSELV